MDLEKLAARARSSLLMVSLVGILIAAIGAVLTGRVIDQTGVRIVQPGPENGAPARVADWVEGLTHATGPMILVGVGLLIATLPWALWPLLSLLHRRALDSRYRSEQLLGNLDSHRQLLESIRDSGSLSDAAKQIAYRAKDLETLRQAIREDMEKQDFEAATILASEMERRFGYGKEADKWREQINATSAAAIEARVRETVEHVNLLTSRFEWSAATREADRLRRQFPDHLEAQRLADRISVARDDQKRELLKRWKDAIAKDDLDASMSLLKQLDQYLSPSEAEAYKENARDVFRKRLQQLGVQFALHVHDKNWGEALRIGQQIAEEFPNTRMAGEVRERLPILKEKAGQTVGV